MAGFGARRFQLNMESQRREHERFQWEQQQYDREQHESRQEQQRREYERHQRERRQYEEQVYQQQLQQQQIQQEQQQQQQQQQQHWLQQDNYERARTDQQRAYDSAYHGSHDGASSSRGVADTLATSHRTIPSSSSTAYDQDSAYADLAYSLPTSDDYARAKSIPYSATAVTTSASTAVRSATLDSVKTESTGFLAYDRGPTSSAPTSLDVPIQRSTARDTIYDDDYEETAEISGPHRHTGLLVPEQGENSEDASFTITRATVFEPELPKAKCADCGEKLDLEELADHSCLPRGASSASLLTINLPPRSADDGGLASASSASPVSLSPSVAPTTPRSPFFDKYQTLLGNGGPLSPAFSTPATPNHVSSFETVSSWKSSSSTSTEQDDTPKAHAVRIVGPQAAVKLTNIKSSASFSSGDGAPVAKCEPPTMMQRSASDDSSDAAAARRKMIEEQRAAKKRGIAAAAQAVKAAIHLQKSAADSPVSQPSKSPVTSPTKPASLSRQPAPGHFKTESSSSVSTAASDLLESSRYARNGRTARIPKDTDEAPVSDLTPSTSYEQFSDMDVSPAKAKTAWRKDALSPTKKKYGNTIDLGGIEEMVKDLTDSPEQLIKTLPNRRDDAKASLKQGSVAVHRGKSEREKVLEKELDRLRERERSRQLQMLRLKEKKRREREAKRCCVCNCTLSSSRTPFVERDGKLLCARDWKELYLPKCRKCNLSVEKGAVKSSDGALRGVFHRECFGCAACDAPFTDGSFYVYNNQPYCARHYHRLNNSLCRECETGIEGDCRQTDTGEKYHPACFRCQYTSSSSKNSGPCGESLVEYYFVGGQRLCERHADRVSRKLAKQGGQQHLDLRADKRKTMLHSLR
ncbi:hypothetical protein BCV70DRAFT_211422 [Testicularia cyperi]|uniref:LIM zinc-binding domain-containing protein n=1 Tax=Testicularia cyperi TaxID=1882483 RepID=A0A317XQR6_9BASI|nr:hypothetical protein BCV70DRAFT_211422 [Testicularia cyperi]